MLCQTEDGACLSGVASNMTTVTLKQGSTTLNVSGLGSPVLLRLPVTLPESVDSVGGACDPDPAKVCRDGAAAAWQHQRLRHAKRNGIARHENS